MHDPVTCLSGVCHRLYMAADQPWQTSTQLALKRCCRHLSLSAPCNGPEQTAGLAGLLIPGRSEKEINQEIFELVAADFGTRKHWHTRLVRVGENTIHPIHVKAPNLVLQEDDIAFIDLGPVFGDIEADFARSYVVGESTWFPLSENSRLSYTKEPCPLLAKWQHC